MSRASAAGARAETERSAGAEAAQHKVAAAARRALEWLLAIVPVRP